MNKLLQAAITAREALIAPQYKDAYNRIVAAGMKAALHRGVDGMMAGIQKYPNPIQACAIGSVTLTLMLQAHATGHMPPEAIVPASYTLMCQALAFCEEAGLVKIDEPTLAHATSLWANNVFAKMRIPPARLDSLRSQALGVMNDPGKMEIINRHTGYARDPNASTPMEAPAVTAPMNRQERRRARRAAARGGTDVAA